jgi:hypothetical protein
MRRHRPTAMALTAAAGLQETKTIRGLMGTTAKKPPKKETIGDNPAPRTIGLATSKNKLEFYHFSWCFTRSNPLFSHGF